ncbi:hypothetical protein DRP53_11055 [candidate division WOR-3 bacterium]|uniref:LSM domain-containing protein n=1 Tax=candidate division WOR-3 bacterium TaxID=2052148 RepID=A0A660SCA7_UNCW3|nr:MAG: hypothetical protein DRP53_11055 [candidate division WOR-3 bacterium]
MKQKVVEIKIYTGDVYEGVLLQSDPEKVLILDEITGMKVRIYNNVIVSVRTLGWREQLAGVC